MTDVLGNIIMKLDLNELGLATHNIINDLALWTAW